MNDSYTVELSFAEWMDIVEACGLAEGHYKQMDEDVNADQLVEVVEEMADQLAEQ